MAQQPAAVLRRDLHPAEHQHSPGDQRMHIEAVSYAKFHSTIDCASCSRSARMAHASFISSALVILMLVAEPRTRRGEAPILSIALASSVRPSSELTSSAARSDAIGNTCGVCAH